MTCGEGIINFPAPVSLYPAEHHYVPVSVRAEIGSGQVVAESPISIMDKPISGEGEGGREGEQKKVVYKKKDYIYIYIHIYLYIK